MYNNMRKYPFYYYKNSALTTMHYKVLIPIMLGSVMKGSYPKTSKKVDPEF